MSDPDNDLKIDSYTLILTRGSHTISSTAAETIRTAIANKVPSVIIDADLLGDGFVRTDVEIFTSHVILLIPNRTASTSNGQTIPFGPNVVAMRTQRRH